MVETFHLLVHGDRIVEKNHKNIIVKTKFYIQPQHIFALPTEVADEIACVRDICEMLKSTLILSSMHQP